MRLLLGVVANLGTSPRLVDKDGDPLDEGVRTSSIENWLHSLEACPKHVQSSKFEPMAIAFVTLLVWAHASGMEAEVRRCSQEGEGVQGQARKHIQIVKQRARHTPTS